MMKNQSATYGRTRTDWSSEVKAPRNGMDTRAAWDTGLGDMNARAASDTGRGGMEMRTLSETGRNGMDARAMSETGRNGAMSETGRNGATWDMNARAASDTGRGGMETRALSETGRGGELSDTGRGGVGNPDEWPPDDDTLILPDNDRATVPMGPRTVDSQEMGEIWPNIENNLSNEVIESPTTMEEVYRGSMKSLLLRNVGNYVVATFLIGTQTTVSWEGILYDVGNDYLAIYQSGRDQYIVSDLYSLKYVEFYDTRRRELCDSLLTAQEPTGNFQRQ